MQFFSKSNSKNDIKIGYYSTKLQTNLSWLLFMAHGVLWNWRIYSGQFCCIKLKDMTLYRINLARPHCALTSDIKTSDSIARALVGYRISRSNGLAWIWIRRLRSIYQKTAILSSVSVLLRCPAAARRGI